MSERGPEINVSTEQVSKVVTLSREITRIKVLDDRSPEANERARNFLKGNFSSQYESVEQMVNLSRDPGRLENDVAKKNAQESLNLLGSALLLAGQDKKIETWVTGAEVYKHLPSSFAGVERILQNNLLVNGKDDEIGKGIVEQLAALEKANRRAAMAPNSYKEKKKEQTQETINNLLDVYETVDSDSEAGLKIGAVVGCLDSELKEEVAPEKKIYRQEEEEIDDENRRVDGRAIIENIQRKDDKEYRSPYEITPESFVDSIFNQDNPRLFFTPPPEWVAKLSSKEQHLLKIQQRLAIGAATKLGVKDISAEKARQNEIYNFPTTELGLIYEMPGVREAMETFTGELLEFYEEDGRRFLRLKLKSNGEVADDVLHNLGHDKSGFSFEDYKEGLYLRMALKKIYPDKSDDFIKENWLELSKQEKKKYVDENKGKGRKTDAQLEFDWITKNALEEKRAVATAWNFLFVGNIIESADTTRRLKPSQVNSDKIRTMMMPLEKFMQKLSIRNEEIKGTEEFFGGSIALWARKMMDDKDQGKEFARKVIYAADHNRDEMTEEQAMWRLLPKRTMCGFCDFYLVKTKEGEKMTMSRALIEKKEISFEGDDLDVFVSVRDTWDELNSVTPFLIGKGEYSPIQQPEKYALAVEKLRGLVTGIRTIELTDQESRRQGGRKFGNEKFVDCPEFYAWLIANSVGLETNLDIPVLKMSVLKADKDTYNDYTNNLVRLLNLDSKKALIVKTILNGKNWMSAKLAITGAEKRAIRKENRKLAEEKKRR